MSQALNQVKRCLSCGTDYPLSHREGTCTHDQGTLVLADADKLIGSFIANRYKISKALGIGGWGSVYLGEDEKLNRPVAVKIIHGYLQSNDVRTQRFQREARIISSLVHPNIVTIHDSGVLASGQPYMVMEHLNGQSLDTLLEQTGKLSAQRTVNIALQMCLALTFAHDAGVIHRDLKPHNVMILASDFVKLLDFGLAKQNDTGASLTATGETVGSPVYMSPEQCRGVNVDVRSDIYSFGMILYQMLNGEPAFHAETLYELMHLHITQKPKAFLEINPGSSTPATLEKIVMKCLEKDPAQRYQSVERLHRDIEAFAQREYGLAARRHASFLLAPFQPERWQRLRLRCVGLLRRLSAKQPAIAIALVAILIPTLILIAFNHPTNNQGSLPPVDGKTAFDRAYREGITLWNEGDYRHAQPKLEEARLHANAVGEENQLYQDTLKKLIDTYKHTGEFAKAKKTQTELTSVEKFSSSLGTIEDTLVKISELAQRTPATVQDKKELARLYTNLAILQLLQTDLSKALQSAATAVTSSEKAYGPQDPETGSALAVMTDCLIDTQRFTQAEKQLNRLLQLAEQNASTQPRLLADAHFLAGKLHYQEAVLPEGKSESFEVILSDVLPRLQPDALTKIKTAITEFERSIQLYNSIYQGDSPKLADALLQLGKAQMYSGDLLAARKNFESALGMDLRVRGEDSEQLGRVQYNLARLLNFGALNSKGPEKKQLLSRANDLVANAQRIFELRSSDVSTSQMLAEIMNMHALVNANMGNFDEAEKLYKGTLSMTAIWKDKGYTTFSAYQRLMHLYQDSNLPLDEKRRRQQAISSFVQEPQKSPTGAPVQAVGDLDKPIGDNDR
jgi:serine/threonine protein kinase